MGGEPGMMSPWKAPSVALVPIYKDDFYSHPKVSVQHYLATQGQSLVPGGAW